MITAGVTGGIGSGKTAFCKELEKLGAFVIYADDFAKELMQQDEELRQQIKQTFGEESYTAAGQLNRAYLAEEAFQKGRVEELNNLVHPLLWKRLNALAEKKKKEGVQLFVIEAAILLNKGRPDFFDYVILIQSGKELRTKRVMKRDKAQKNQVLDRMKKQPNFEQLSHLSDFEVYNDGTLADLKNKAGEVFRELKIRTSQ